MDREGMNEKKEWYHQESNRGHKDFQSFALPTELRHRLNCDANIERKSEPPNLFKTFFQVFWLSD